MIKVRVSQLARENFHAHGSLPPSEFQLENEDMYIFIGEIHYDVRANLVGGGVIAESVLSGELECTCGRCICKFKRPFEIRDSFHFYENPSSDEIDLTPDLREDILMSFPQNFLCSDTCKGLCPICGLDRNKSECNCAKTEKPDDVWKELDRLVKPVRQRKNTKNLKTKKNKPKD